jgi:hypothetical protein
LPRYHDPRRDNDNLANSQLSLTTTSPDKNPKENPKNASLNDPKRSEVPEHMSVMKTDMNPNFVGQSLHTDALRGKMMSIGVWILDSMHADLSPQQFSLSLMVQVKFVRFELHHMLLLIAEFTRSPGFIQFEPASVPMQIVSDLDLQSCVRDDPQLPWPLLDRLYAL